MRKHHTSVQPGGHLRKTMVNIIKREKMAKKKVNKKNYFDSTIKLFEDYRSKMIKEKPNGYNSNLSNEVHVRLRQLSYICKKLCSYEQIILKPTPSIDEARKLKRFFDEGIVFAEAFYSTAWRIICIAKHGTKPLPHLGGMMKKARGINTVRNQLLVHPEKQKEQILMISYGWGNDGPMFKVGRPAGQTFEIKDSGLWINAQEFKNDFEGLLQKAIVL